MRQSYGYRPSTGKIIGCTILAVVLGILAPFALMFQVMMPMPALNIVVLLAAALSVGGGLIPAVVLGVAALVGTLVGLGPGITVLEVLMCVPSAVVMIRGVRRKEPFFRQMFHGVAVCMACVIAAVLLAGVFFGGDMIEKAVDFVRSMFEQQQDVLWASVQEMLGGSGSGVTQTDFAGVYYDALNLMEAYYEYNLLANLLTGAAMTGVVGVLWGNWLAARRGEVTPDSFRGLGEWYLPSNLTLGLLMMLLFSAVLKGTSFAGGTTVWVIVSGLARLAFVIQALAAVDRRLKAQGSARGRRTAMVVLVIVAGTLSGDWFLGLDLFGIVAIAGCASALFGRRGAARPIVDKIKKDMDGDSR